MTLTDAGSDEREREREFVRVLRPVEVWAERDCVRGENAAPHSNLFL